MAFTRRMMMAAVAAVAMFGVTAQAQADLKIGVDLAPYPPFTSKNPAGEWEGWEVDIINALCAELGETCTIEGVAWDGIIPALTAKKIDAIISSMSITDERKKTINFSDMYYKSAPIMIGAKNGDMDFSPEHLSGKTIGVQKATTHSAYIDKYYAPKGAVVKIYAGQDEANADLAAGRIDYIEADGITLGTFLDSDEGKACCEKKGAVPDDPAVLGAGVGVGLRQEDTAMRDKFNAAVKALANKGTYEEAAKKWGLEGKLIFPPKVM
jgi:polar amino acid transport system substrate-binding protein